MKRFVVGSIVLVLSLACIGWSFARQFSVYEEDVGLDDFAFFEEIPERVLASDATFSGVFRSKVTGRLISDYDRSQPRGRTACPT